MFGWLSNKLTIQRYRSAWFVGSVFALLIALGLMWRGLYLYFLE